MKMEQNINNYRKEFVYKQYTRIVNNFKEYEKISRKKMLEAVYKVYSDYNNIIDICTTRELKYLKLLLNASNNSNKEYLDKKYEWEANTLKDKFLIIEDFTNEDVLVPEEIITNVKEAISNIDWKIAKKRDELNEIMIGYCKIQGSALLNVVISVGEGITEIDRDEIYKHILSNKVFNYYVYITTKDFETIGEDIPIAIHEDYYYLMDELDEQRQKQGIAGNLPIYPAVYKTIFYNDFDIDNPMIKKFLDELEKTPVLYIVMIDLIKEFAMLNLDRKPLKDMIANAQLLEEKDTNKLLNLLDKAMDEMPSGALNGFTPNEAQKVKLETETIKQQKKKNYIKQKNAHLSKQDAKLFYKIYFALLEFTNKKYKIKPSIKLYNKKGINPYNIKDIVNMFWENKDLMTVEFCLANPYKFTKEELNIASDFKKGIRDIFVIAKYEEDYTAIMSRDKVYMIKGINDNIDNIISYKDLPSITQTSIIPFKGNLIYDGMFYSFDIRMGNDFAKTVDREYNSNIKYYHL